MATRLYFEEEGNLEDSLELNSIRSQVLESLKSNRYSRISFTIDLDTFHDKFNEMLASVGTACDKIQELSSYCKWSVDGKFAHSLIEAVEPNPQDVFEHLIEIKLLIKAGLSHVETLYQSANEIFELIGGLLLFEVRLPDLPDFEVPQSSLLESLTRMFDQVEVSRVVSSVISKDCIQFLINCASNHILMYRRYTSRMKGIIRTYFGHRISSEIRLIKEDMQCCLGKVADFGMALEQNEVSAKLKSANTWLEYAISRDSPVALANLKSLFQAYDQFRISFESFIKEDYNREKSKEQLFQEMKCHSISRGLISPIVSSLRCSSETAWCILNHLHSLYNGQASSICEHRLCHLSISSDNALD